jgi:hypothetical protein
LNPSDMHGWTPVRQLAPRTAHVRVAHHSVAAARHCSLVSCKTVVRATHEAHFPAQNRSFVEPTARGFTLRAKNAWVRDWDEPLRRLAHRKVVT